MVRVKCIVSYDGSKFYGFQIQNKLRTVQGEIQKALKKICEEEVTIHASGRTDAKVHGNKQVFHFDTSRQMPEKQWKRAINHFLPNDIYILDSLFVSEDFHSRYSATKKEYHYLLSTNEYSPFETNYIYQYGRPLDLELMKDAASIFIGEHDFASFCSYDQYGNTIRELYKIIVLIICIIASIFCGQEILNNTEKNEVITSQAITNIEEIPSYTDKIYIEINYGRI